MSELRKAVSTPHAPQAIGPYSQAIRTGNLLFLSGQIPLDPQSKMVVEGDVVLQTHQVMKNILAVLDSQGLGAGNIVKTTIFLKDLNDFPLCNQTYETYLTAPYPARSTVQVAKLPLDVLVEIETLAVYG